MSETARASCWAHTVNAWPVPGLFSRRARDGWPVGWSRRNTTAAAANAHCREAFPIVVPAVPSRVPADACAHVTQRQEETPSGTRGKRWRSCSASRSTRRRIVPIPGTVWRTDRVWASCCFAALTMGHATSLRSWSSSPSSARATALLCWTAGAGKRAATPRRWALEASFFPISGRVY